jgi:AcrR family transcriptional regulator
MPVMTQSQSSRGMRKAAILEASVAIFGSVPYDGVAVDDIAARAGVAHGLVFHYFGNKRGLYLAVLRRTAADLELVHVPPGEPASPSRLVRAIISAHLDYIEQHPETLRAFLRGGIGADPEARQIVEESRWEGIRQLLDVLRLERPSPAVKLAMRGWVGFLDEAMIYWLEHDARVARRRFIDMAVEVLVSALTIAQGQQDRGGRDPRELR